MRKSSVSFLILAGILVLLSLVAATAETVPPAAPPDSGKVTDSITTAPQSHRVIAYYFHGTRRCSNCIKIEKFTKESLDSSFASALGDSSLIWMVVNTDNDSGRHFLQDYQLYTKSVILSELHDGKEMRWKNLEKVWEHLGDKAAFMNYIREEVTAYLKVD